jgi:hypothetical protein
MLLGWNNDVAAGRPLGTRRLLFISRPAPLTAILIPVKDNFLKFDSDFDTRELTLWKW